jgi:hypothetical protein
MELSGSFPFPLRGGKGIEGMEGEGIDAVSPAIRRRSPRRCGLHRAKRVSFQVLTLIMS